MNIFVLDECPIQSAKWNCDQHVQSAVKEFHQMLACCFTLEQLSYAPLTKDGNIRKHSYYNHQCTIWLRESEENLRWWLAHLNQIYVQFMLRFNTIPNASFINWVNKNISSISFRSKGLTPFAVAFTAGSVAAWCRDSSRIKDAVELYKTYYVHDKPFATWKINKPDWIK